MFRELPLLWLKSHKQTISFARVLGCFWKAKVICIYAGDGRDVEWIDWKKFWYLREKVNYMLALKDLIIHPIGGLPASDSRKVGSMKGQKFIADGHEIDDYDDEIAPLFESGPDDTPRLDTK